MGLILVNVPGLVGKDAKVEVSLANEDRVPERETDHSRSEKTSLKCSGPENRILGKRKRIDNLHPDSFGSLDSNTACVFKSFGAER